MRRLLDAAGGLTRIFTLAPERDTGLAVTRMLAGRGLIVLAGHCNPSLDELDAAIEAGLSMFTHLGNGCPLAMHRHDNIIHRALSRADRLTIRFIADGTHIGAFRCPRYADGFGICESVSRRRPTRVRGGRCGAEYFGGLAVRR